MIRQEGILSSAKLRSFFMAWGEVVDVVKKVKASSDAGNFIQYPKVPQIVSESIAAKILLRENVFVGATRFVRGGGSDLTISSESMRFRVEVKGSGSAEFQTFGPNDYACDMLVWLRFGDVSQLGISSMVRATLFPKPSEAIGNLGSRVVYSAAEAAAARRGSAIRQIEIPLEALLA